MGVDWSPDYTSDKPSVATQAVSKLAELERTVEFLQKLVRKLDFENKELRHRLDSLEK